MGICLHSKSSGFKLAAGFAKQVREEFPTTNPAFGLNVSKGKVYAQRICPNRFIAHLLVKPKFWNKPPYRSLRAALEAILQHVWKHKIEKISISRLSTGLDKLKWLKVKGIITDVFHNTPIKVTVYTQQQQQNSGSSGTQKEKGTLNDLQQAQETIGFFVQFFHVLKQKTTALLSPSRPVKRNLGSLEQY